MHSGFIGVKISESFGSVITFKSLYIKIYICVFNYLLEWNFVILFIYLFMFFITQDLLPYVIFSTDLVL
jgi:hypothetical protein